MSLKLLFTKLGKLQIKTILVDLINYAGAAVASDCVIEAAFQILLGQVFFVILFVGLSRFVVK